MLQVVSQPLCFPTLNKPGNPAADSQLQRHVGFYRPLNWAAHHGEFQHLVETPQGERTPLITPPLPR